VIAAVAMRILQRGRLESERSERGGCGTEVLEEVAVPGEDFVVEGKVSNSRETVDITGHLRRPDLRGIRSLLPFAGER